MGRKCRDVI